MLRCIINISLCIAILLFSVIVKANNRPVINMADYLTEYVENGDATAAVSKALSDCKNLKASKLVFPKGKYHFYPYKAFEKYMFISNNDEGLKRITFPLIDFKDFEIDGQGSDFIFHGYVCPFITINSSNISFKNFQINWDRTFHSEGKIDKVYKDSIDVSFSEQFSYKVEKNLLFFFDKSGIQYPYKSLLEFDSNKRETAFKAGDYYTGPYIKVKDLGDKKVRLFVKGINAVENNIMTFAPSGRLCPAITLSHSKKILVENVKIYHAGGMGVIAQMCADVRLNQISVTPSKDRIISTTADATHFVNCTGYITIENSLFENQKDDATNIHGIYASVVEKVDETSFLARLVHKQQYGQQLFKAGDSIEFVEGKSLNTYSVGKVKNIEVLNKEYVRIILEQAVPNRLMAKDAVAALQFPEVIIRQCTIRNNRARGILLGSRGKTLIENNYFHTPGAAILFEGDARFWYEQAGVRDVLITGNTFDNCNYGVWGNALFQVGSGITEEERENSRYNQGIVIRNNLIKFFDPRIANIYSVRGFTFDKNKLVKTTDYKSDFSDSKPFLVKNSDDVKIDH